MTLKFSNTIISSRIIPQIIYLFDFPGNRCYFSSPLSPQRIKQSFLLLFKFTAQTNFTVHKKGYKRMQSTKAGSTQIKKRKYIFNSGCCVTKINCCGRQITKMNAFFSPLFLGGSFSYGICLCRFSSSFFW